MAFAPRAAGACMAAAPSTNELGDCTAITVQKYTPEKRLSIRRGSPAPSGTSSPPVHARQSSPSEDALVTNMPVEKYLDMRISKIRGHVDWRINDLAGVVQQTEDSLFQQLDAERQNRQDSVDTVQQLAMTTKLMMDASLSAESSRIDSACQDIANCQLELKVLSDHINVNASGQSLQQNDTADGHTAGGSPQLMAESSCAQPFMGNLGAAQTETERLLLVMALELEELRQQQDAFKKEWVAGLAAERSERGEAIAGMRCDMDQWKSSLADSVSRGTGKDDVNAQQKTFASTELEELRQKQLAFFRVALQEVKNECLARLEDEESERREAVEIIRYDMDQWDSSLFKERLDIMNQRLDDMSGLQEGIPSSDALEAARDGHTTHLASRLDTEQNERREALRCLQKSLSDIESIQTGQRQELGTLRSNFLKLPDRLDKTSLVLDNELRDVRDAISGLKCDMKAQDVTIQTTMAEATDRIVSITGECDDTKRRMQKLKSSVMSSSNMFKACLEEVDTQLKLEQHQRKDALESVRQDLTALPDVITESFWNSLSPERDRVDALAQKLDFLAPKVDDLVLKVDASDMALTDLIEISLSPERDRVSALAQILYDLAPKVDNLVLKVDASKTSERDRVDALAQQLDGLAPKVNDLKLKVDASRMSFTGIIEIPERDRVDELARKLGDLAPKVDDLVLKVEASKIALTDVIEISLSPERDRVDALSRKLDGLAPKVDDLQLKVDASRMSLTGAIEVSLSPERDRVDALARKLGDLTPKVDDLVLKVDASKMSLTDIIEISLSTERDRVDALTQKLDDLAPKVDDLVPKVEAFKMSLTDIIEIIPVAGAQADSGGLCPAIAQALDHLDAADKLYESTRHNLDAIVATQQDLDRLPGMFMKAVARDEERLNLLGQEVEDLKQQRLHLEPSMRTASASATFEAATIALGCDRTRSIETDLCQDPGGDPNLAMSTKSSGRRPEVLLEDATSYFLREQALQVQMQDANAISSSPHGTVQSQDVIAMGGVSSRTCSRTSSKSPNETEDISSKLEALMSWQKTQQDSFSDQKGV